MIVRSLIAVVVALGAYSAADPWHNELKRSAPKADEVLTQPPAEIRLWFAQAVEPELTGIGLTKADGAVVPLGKVRATDDPVSVSAQIVDPLAPGSYKVTWSTKGDDIHSVKGKFSFTVR
jgi:methionine-rich copper-binding protein CopC